MSDWSQRPDALEKDFEFDDFKQAMAFVDRVADVAEEANHHPDILVHGRNKVRLTLPAHSEGGLTDADHARATDRRGHWRVSPVWCSLDRLLRSPRRPDERRRRIPK